MKPSCWLRRRRAATPRLQPHPGSESHVLLSRDVFWRARRCGGNRVYSSSNAITLDGQRVLNRQIEWRVRAWRHVPKYRSRLVGYVELGPGPGSRT